MPTTRTRCAAAILFFAALSVKPTASQISSTPQSNFPSQSSPATRDPHGLDAGKSGPEDATHERFEVEAAKARNTERLKRIQSDTEKLLALSTELKADVDKTTKNEMSLDVIRKAAEVEKLAHDIRERMKG